MIRRKRIRLIKIAAAAAAGLCVAALFLPASGPWARLNIPGTQTTATAASAPAPLTLAQLTPDAVPPSAIAHVQTVAALRDIPSP